MQLVNHTGATQPTLCIWLKDTGLQLSPLDRIPPIDSMYLTARNDRHFVLFYIPKIALAQNITIYKALGLSLI